MSINFAGTCYFTNVSCSSVTADRYEATNLISEGAKGFQGESFVRAPVAVQFDFYIPVSVNRIDLSPWIGRQCAKFIQIFISSTHPCAKKDEHKESVPGCDPDDRFRKAGETTLSAPTRVCFINRGYRPNPRLKIPPLPEAASVAYLNGNLGNVTAVKIVIRRMLTGSVPSLSHVKIWGRPSRYCSSALAKEIYRIQKREEEKRLAEDHHMTEPIMQSTCMTNDVGAARDCKTEVVCPQEFIDPLTYEVMRIPIRLPSGHTIDRKTLDKHVKSQAEVGNVASDPFTGIQFTYSSKPVPNTELKARMDSHFLKVSQLAQGGKPNHDLNVCTSLKRKVLPSAGHSSKTSKLDVTSKVNISEHARNLSESLDAGLRSVANVSARLGGRTLATTPGDGVKSLSLFCSGCSNFLFSTSLRYRLPCSHVLCHKCVQSCRQDSNCPSCSTPCKSSEVERVY